MREVAEEGAPKRVVTHVLNHATPVGIGMSLPQLFRGGVGKSFEQERLDVVNPLGVDDRFVSKYRVPKRRKGKAERTPGEEYQAGQRPWKPRRSKSAHAHFDGAFDAEGYHFLGAGGRSLTRPAPAGENAGSGPSFSRASSRLELTSRYT